MSRWQSIRRLLGRWFSSLPFFAVLGLALGLLIAIPAIPRPNVAAITISGPILDQSYADSILDTLKHAGDDNRIKAVVLRIDSPGGSQVIEQIYLDLLRLRGQKPIVASIGSIAASGGYYIAVASNFIYAEPTSLIGNIGAWVVLPQPEELDENITTTGPFKATGGSRRKVIGYAEMIRQEFVEAVTLQRGNRLKLSEEELSRGEIYVGVEGLRNGLIDDIGTRATAIEKAAALAGLRNYRVVELYVSQPSYWFFGSSDLAALKAETGLIPKYYYLYFESR